MLKRIEVEYNGQRVVLSEATTAMSIRREFLRPDNISFADVEQRIAGKVFYPDIMACVVETEGFETWPPTVEAFVNEWPARFTDKLRDTCYELNPHWWMSFEETEVKKKEVTRP